MYHLRQVRALTFFLFLIIALASIGCGRVGPLEKKLNQLSAEYEALAAAGKPDRKAAIDLLRKITPLLSEKNYSDGADLGKQKQIMYRASLLLVRIAHAARLEKASRAFYMNAYLLEGKKALEDVRRGLPAGTDLTIFRNIHVPAYKLTNSRSDKLDFSAPRYKDLDAKTRERTRRISVEAAIQEVPAYYLMQMLCGDVLHKLKDKHQDLGALRVKITANGKPAATGTWDFASDELVLRLPDKR